MRKRSACVYGSTNRAGRSFTASEWLLCYPCLLRRFSLQLIFSNVGLSRRDIGKMRVCSGFFFTETGGPVSPFDQADPARNLSENIHDNRERTAMRGETTRKEPHEKPREARRCCSVD